MTDARALPLMHIRPLQTLKHDWILAQGETKAAARLQPGEWLAHPRLPLAFFSQPDEKTLRFIVREADLRRLEKTEEPALWRCGEALAPDIRRAEEPDEKTLPARLWVGHGLSGLGGALLALRHAASRKRRDGTLAIFDLTNEDTLPFQPAPSRFWLPDLPAEMIAALPLLEDWGIPNRLLHATSPGCWPHPFSTLRQRLAQRFTIVELGERAFA